MPKRVLIIQNDSPETLGNYETYLEKKADLTLVHAYRMEKKELFPPINDFEYFIIGPTPISANDATKHMFLRKEWEYLKQIIKSEKPCLGVCCGAQMLAKIQGGYVKPSPGKEIGGYRVRLTEDGLRDPLFSGFPQDFPVFQWHSEMFTVPPTGKLLAEGNPCTIQAYMKDQVRGIIFHLEINKEEAKRWISAYPEEPHHIGKSKSQVLRECREIEEEMLKLAKKLIDNFLSM